MSIAYISERQRIAEERKRQSIVDRAARESDVLRKIRYERAEEKAAGKILFCWWYILDSRLCEMEKQRDAHIPKSRDGPWDDEFCQAIQEIPKLKRACKDAWFAYTTYGKPSFNSYI